MSRDDCGNLSKQCTMQMCELLEVCFEQTVIARCKRRGQICLALSKLSCLLRILRSKEIYQNTKQCDGLNCLAEWLVRQDTSMRSGGDRASKT